MKFESHREFIPFPLLTNCHSMTIAPVLWRRRFPRATTTGLLRFFAVEPGTKILTYCHWQLQPRKAPTLIVLHGLEGHAGSHYVLGVTEKAMALGMNVVRMNMRNCGDSLHLTPTLYNSGMSNDLLAVVRELKLRDKLGPIFLTGYSMGGNIVLKVAAELKQEGKYFLSGVSVVSPALDLASCVAAIGKGFNRVYQQRFLLRLKSKLKKKNLLFPGMYDLTPLHRIRSMHEFDDCYTAPFGGYGNAADYYSKASALPILDQIRVPTLIIHAQDDPFVPFAPFNSEKLQNPYITLLAPRYGGHAAFVHKYSESNPPFDRFWAENRVVNFCQFVLR